MIQQVTRGLDHCINLCDQCTWGQHKALVSQAQYVITTDTVTSHIAEAYCRPTLVLMADHTDSTLWSPPHAIAIKQSEASADAVARLVTNRFQPSPL
jgi:ADP-heptose:LPS heptosyltransferase